MKWKFCTSRYEPQIQEASFGFAMNRMRGYTEMAYCSCLQAVTVISHYRQGWFRTSSVLAATTKLCNPMHPLLPSFMGLTKTSHIILHYSNPLSSNYTYFQLGLSTHNLVKKLSILFLLSLPIHWKVFATKKCVTLLGLNNPNFLPFDLSYLSLKTRESSRQASQMFRSYQLKYTKYCEGKSRSSLSNGATSEIQTDRQPSSFQYC